MMDPVILEETGMRESCLNPIRFVGNVDLHLAPALSNSKRIESLHCRPWHLQLPQLSFCMVAILTVDMRQASKQCSFLMPMSKQLHPNGLMGVCQMCRTEAHAE